MVIKQLETELMQAQWRIPPCGACKESPSIEANNAEKNGLIAEGKRYPRPC